MMTNINQKFNIIKLRYMSGFKLTYCDSGNTIHFSISRCKFSYLVKKSQYQSIMQFLILKHRNLFFAAVKNNFNMPGVDKSRMCVCYIFKIINFTNCCTWLFPNKYVTLCPPPPFCRRGLKIFQCCQKRRDLHF